MKIVLDTRMRKYQQITQITHEPPHPAPIKEMGVKINRSSFLRENRGGHPNTELKNVKPCIWTTWTTRNSGRASSSCSTYITRLVVNKKMWLSKLEYIRGHLWHRYSVSVNQVMVATVRLSKCIVSFLHTCPCNFVVNTEVSESFFPWRWLFWTFSNYYLLPLADNIDVLLVPT